MVGHMVLGSVPVSANHTPQYPVFLQKMTVVQLVNKFHLYKPKICYLEALGADGIILNWILSRMG
jgi:hypothetical protein